MSEVGVFKLTALIVDRDGKFVLPIGPIPESYRLGDPKLTVSRPFNDGVARYDLAKLVQGLGEFGASVQIFPADTILPETNYELRSQAVRVKRAASLDLA